MNTRHMFQNPESVVVGVLTDVPIPVYRICQATALWPEEVRNVIRTLQKNGVVTSDGRGRYRLSPSLGTAKTVPSLTQHMFSASTYLKTNLPSEKVR